MGSFKSRELRTDTIIAIENYSQELGHRYHDSQEKLENFSKEYIEKKEFDSKIQEIEHNLAEHSRNLQSAMEDEVFLKDQTNSLEVKLKAMEIEIKTNDEKLKALEQTFATKLDGYDEELQAYQRRVSELEKEANDSNEVVVFKLSKFARLNGIMKAKDQVLRHQAKESPDEDFWISLVDTGAKSKKKNNKRNLLRRKKNKYTLRESYACKQEQEVEDPNNVHSVQVHSSTKQQISQCILPISM